MALAASPINERKRVKVYELKDSDWYDRGTGFCAVQTILQDETIFVESEDNGRPLLTSKVEKDYNYQKQQETLIVWTDSDALDMALSFQESEGCALVWNSINEVQARLGTEGFNLSLPDVDLAHLGEIEQLIRTAMNTSQGRDSFMKHIEQEGWLARLVPLVQMAEDLESLPDLHKLCNIFKSLILFNDNKFIEDVVTDDMIMGVVGALEYDPDFPEHKANHRQYLSDKSRFKEVVPIHDDKVRARIHGTFRLQYLKDVVLARILDDPTFSVLNSLIYFYQMDILGHIASNPAIVKQIFTVITSPEQSQQKKKDAVLFIQQCTSIAKNANANARAQLYHSFVTSGLFSIIAFALQNQDAAVRVAGVDIFLTIIDHDAIMMRNLVFKAISEKTKPMTETLVDLFLVEPDLGVKAQVADAIKILLEPMNQQNAMERAAATGDNSFVAKLRSPAMQQQNDQHLTAFFEGPAAKKLFEPLEDLASRQNFKNFSVHEVSMYGHLIEILCFFMRTQSYKSKLFILEHNLAARVAQLLVVPQKHLKLTAVKYFRAVINLNDEFHCRQLVRDNLFEPILNILIESLPQDNLLNSAILELFEVIRKENMKSFIVHLVESYRERLEAIDIRGIDIFSGLVLRYDQYMNPHLIPPSAPGEGDSSFMTSDAETPNTRHITINGGDPRWQGLKDADAEEDAYFNASDGEEDEEDELSRDVPNATSMFNASPLSKPLVDYGDDDEMDEDSLIIPSNVPKLDADTEMLDIDLNRPTKLTGELPSSSPSAISPLPSDSTHAPSTPTTATSVLLSTPTRPPLSLAEKRRREDDDEVELGKLATTGTASKRRNSSAGRLDISGSVSGDVAKSTTPDAGTTADVNADIANIGAPDQADVASTRATSGQQPASATQDAEPVTPQPKDKDHDIAKDQESATPSMKRTPSLKRKAGFVLTRARSGSRGKSVDLKSDEANAHSAAEKSSDNKKGRISINLGNKKEGE